MTGFVKTVKLMSESLTFLFVAGFKMVDILEETDTTGKVTTDIIRGRKEVGAITTSSTDKGSHTPLLMDNMATTPTTLGLVTIPTDDTCGLRVQQCYVTNSVSLWFCYFSTVL